MRPVALLQHDVHQRPGYLQDFLQDLGIPTLALSPDDGDSVPRKAADFSGVVLLGSEHSVNEPLHWIREECDLVLDAMAAHVPLLGHCFGAQLMARALGAPVRRHVWPDIGWRHLNPTLHAQDLFGPVRDIVAFNWHYETFGIPMGAQRILFGTHCLNKGFRLGPNLAFQCHFEVTPEIVQAWCAHGQQELAHLSSPTVQSPTEILDQLPVNLPRLRLAAQQVYGHWAAQLPGSPLARVGRVWREEQRGLWGMRS